MGDTHFEKSKEFSILHLYEIHEPEVMDHFFTDLNLLQVIEKLSAKWGKNVKRYYRYLTRTPEEEDYRRAVFADIKKDRVFQALMAYTEDLASIENLRTEKEKVRNSMQRAVWQIREVGAYCSTYRRLAESLEEAELSSGGMQEFLRILKEILGSGGYREIEERSLAFQQKIREMRFIITYDRDRMSVAIGELPGEGAYEEMLLREGGRKINHLRNPFRADAGLTALENACIEILEKKDPDFFHALRETASRLADYELPVLQRFEKEIPFYLSFRSLELDMEKEGFPFAEPERCAFGEMEGAGLYDLALAIVNVSSGKTVIPNDFRYEQGDRFFVLTGPNQGGKTTFARSLGQLIYFSRMGLDVPARSAALPFYQGIQTHFSVEESVETGRGKLMEELVRLAPMMEDRKSGSFVIINELFTTAASYDAEIMGKKVLKHFIDLGCMGIYVTHLRELTEGIPGVVSMRAMLNDQRIQTFEIRRAPAEDIPCAENQVNKYRLTYAQLKERL